MSEIRFRPDLQAPELQAISLPVEVRKSRNLVLVTRALSTESVTLDPGDYFATAQLPAGQELLGSFTVVDGEDATIDLLLDREDAAPTPSEQMPLYFLGAQSVAATPPVTARRAGPERSPGILRLFGGNALRASLRVEPVEELLQPVSTLTPSVSVFTCRPGLDLLLQVLQSSAPARNMVLPVSPERGCQVIVSTGPDGVLRVDVRFENPAADALFQFARRSLWDQALPASSSLTMQADLLLAEKGGDPVAATLGAYVLLRFADLDGLGGSTRRLHDGFEWLPDGIPILAEHLAREGKHEDALRTLLKLPSRGLPVFTAGLTYAINRLRSYVDESDPWQTNADSLSAVRVLEQLQRLARYVDFHAPLLTFTGLDPLRPDSTSCGTSIEMYDGLRISPYPSVLARRTSDLTADSGALDEPDPEAIDLAEVGAHPYVADRKRKARFGMYLPGIAEANGYKLEVLVVHERDQFDYLVPPRTFNLVESTGHPLGLWTADITLDGSGGHFGQDGTYLYRYRLQRHGTTVVNSFADPFARTVGRGSLSSFQMGVNSSDTFTWSDSQFTVPDLDDLIVYELQVAEFAGDFDGVVKQLDYLAGLGVNCLELMPVTNVPEKVEWGYTPLGYFAPDDRLGGPVGFKRLVDACHARGIAVIVDAVYGHCHPELAYNLVYQATGVSNPMMGQFGLEFGEEPNKLIGPNYYLDFARDFFERVSEYWLEELHVDGFRYDYVPGYYIGPADPGYAELVYRTYRLTQDFERFPRFRGPAGRSRIIQCAEHLDKPIEMLDKTYSNTCWQNAFRDALTSVARSGAIPDTIGHRLDPRLGGYPDAYSNPATGEALPVAPFQYLESHDHSRLINELGVEPRRSIVGEPYGDRRQAYRTRPLAIALMTAKGIPMLWQGQELGENWGLSGGLDPRRILFERPVHWEYFYDELGRPLVTLYRALGQLRQRLPALGARTFLFYVDDASHRQSGVVVFRRQERPEEEGPGEPLVVILNFSDRVCDVEVELGHTGLWRDLIATEEARISNTQRHVVTALVTEEGRKQNVRIQPYDGIMLQRE